MKKSLEGGNRRFRGGPRGVCPVSAYTNNPLSGSVLLRKGWAMPEEGKMTKTKLVEMLIQKGLSVRKARKVVDVVFRSMARAVWRGEVVEIPGGLLKATQAPPRRDFRPQYDLQAKRMKYKFVTYRKPGARQLIFTPTLKLEFETEREKRARLVPKPETAKEREIRELISELLGRPATRSDIDWPEGIVRQRRHRPDSLLNRLRHLKTRVRPPLSAADLAVWINRLWWL